MALHLSGLIKTKHMVFGSSFVSHPVFGEGEEKKNGENLRFARRSGLGWLFFPFIAPKRPNNIQEEI